MGFMTIWRTPAISWKTRHWTGVDPLKYLYVLVLIVLLNMSNSLPKKTRHWGCLVCLLQKGVLFLLQLRLTSKMKRFDEPALGKPKMTRQNPRNIKKNHTSSATKKRNHFIWGVKHSEVWDRLISQKVNQPLERFLHLRVAKDTEIIWLPKVVPYF